MMKSIGDRMKELREDNDFSQSALGKELGISRNSIATYENNNSTPSVDVLIKYADFFNVSTDYILGRVKEKNLKVVEKNNLKVEYKKEAEDNIIEKFVEMISNESLVNVLKSQIKQNNGK